MRRLRVFQRDRYVSIDFQTRQAVVSRRTQTTGAKPAIDVESYQAGDDEPLRLELDSFLQAVASGSRPVVSGEDGEAALNLAMRVLEAIGQFTQRHQGDSAPEIPWDSKRV
jgi:predicted dehydrogenase